MNVLTRDVIDRILIAAGADSTQFGSAKMLLISAPFTPSPDILLSAVTEANFQGYARKSIGTPSVPFTGADGFQYVQGLTDQWVPTGSDSPNTIYGLGLVASSDSTKLIGVDKLDNTVALATPLNSLTITPRIGLNPAGNFGLNVISS